MLALDVAWREGTGPLLGALAARDLGPPAGATTRLVSLTVWGIALAQRTAGGPPLPSIPIGLAIEALIALQAVSLGPTVRAAPLEAHPRFAHELATSPARLEAAGRVVGRLRILELRARLGDRDCQAWLDQRWTRLRAGVPQPLWERLDAGHSFACSALRYCALVAIGTRRPPWRDGPRGPLADARDKALAHLRAHPEAHASWDRQRWGLPPDTTELLCRAYVQATVALARHRAGDPDAAPQLRNLLARTPAAPLRYFEGWEPIPPDSDSLGLFLLCAAEVGGVAPDLRAAWRRPLAVSVRADGTLPTWLTDPERDADPRWSWMGDDCTASRTMLLIGMLAEIECGGGAPGDVTRVVHNLQGILDAWDRGASGSHYYSDGWALVLLLRLERARGATRLPTPVRTRLRERLAAEAAQCAATQAPDGGWGSPLATAAALRLLGWAGSAPVAMSRAVRYLCERQHPDGSWPSEPFFLTIGKPPFVEHHHGGTDLTTALCLSSLVEADQALHDEPHGHH